MFSIGHIHLEQQPMKHLQETFASLLQTRVKKKEKKVTKTWQQLKHLLAELHPQSQHPTRFSGYKLYESGGANFSRCHVTSRWSCDQRIFKGVSLSW